MIFAKVDVTFLRHHRLLDIEPSMVGEAMGGWLAALLYTREHELDGYCPLAAIRHVARDEVFAELVRVGLLTRQEKDGRTIGYTVCKYADHNETRREIGARRKATKERVDAFRKKRDGNADSNADVTRYKSRYKRVSNGARNAVVSGSGSGSGSDSHSDSDSVISEREIQEGDSGAVLRLDAPIPAELREAASMLGVQDVDSAWLKFTGARAGQVVEHLGGAWQAFCATWRNIERRERERDAARSGAKGETDMGTKCTSCGASIRWVITAAGRRMPLDEAPNPKGNMFVFRVTGEPDARAMSVTDESPAAAQFRKDGRERFMPHHATCPSAAQHRKAVAR